MGVSGRSWRRQIEMATIKIYHMHSLEFLIRKIYSIFCLYIKYTILIYILKTRRLKARPSANNEAL